MFVRALLASLFVILPLAAYADTGRVDRIDVIEGGAYEVAKGATVAGSVTLTKKSDTLSARLGLMFGFRFVPVGTPKGAPLKLRLVTRFPGNGVQDPVSGKRLTKTEEAVNAAVGVSLVSGYRIDKTWEVVPGVWTFELWEGNRKLTEKSFTLTER